ncbi:DUF192 domain-containing protein [Candidatus Pacearchaeota archaeon]|nr:DUF192 domain-containing protein [Candidatus Pacearchaeota archaeon]
MKVTFNYKKKTITLNAKNCNLVQKGIGLMFTRKEKAQILLFDFKKQGKNPIHSLFCFLDFVGIWLDDKNEVVDIQYVKPWKLKVKQDKPFTKLIEIPINKKYKNITKKLFT